MLVQDVRTAGRGAGLERELSSQKKQKKKAAWERGARETATLASERLGVFRRALNQLTRASVPNTWEAPVCCMAVTQPSLAEPENSPGLPTATEEKMLQLLPRV